MIANLSPKDLSLVIGVSESSLKRWVDEGRLVAVRTVGGHRRIPLHEAVRFIRASSSLLTRPDLLGLADLTSEPLAAVASGAGEAGLQAALEAGKSEVARGLIVAQFLATRNIAGVCDGPIAHAMHRIGELWRHTSDGILIEHRATEVVIQAIHQLRLLLPPVGDDAPVAVGGGLSKDPYVLPSLMVSAAMLEVGYRDMNYGPDTPVEELVKAAVQQRAQIVWLSVTAQVGEDELRVALRRLAAGVTETGATLVLGGRGLMASAVPQGPGVHVVSSMTELTALGRARLGAGRR